ncbi:diguanylate cyclase [Guptibacillus hwajinpoensis]|uniref:diguanylate cyclase n=1 Tax=Guptibacillus hwajinpoensis TaxID=208199 RepID=UPI00273E5076|nr:diguanylate cyclase [Pseudalkalibacillus hwajinpoensis]WLR61349.1 diguanylate cyclase [Pseudalkalibacillus hwajinpoensis]
MKGIFQKFTNVVSVYITLASITGISLFLTQYFSTYTPLNWSLSFTFVAAILLLNHYTILLPPSGNSLSMDSAIYLAVLFVFGIHMALTILLLTSIIYALYKKSVVWWKHLFNFSIYSIMIIGTYEAFFLFGGTLGTLSFFNVTSYMLSLSVYFLLNVLFIGFFFVLTATENLLQIVKGMLKETISSYLITLILSLNLVLLMKQQIILGVLLFLTVAVLLSISFKQYFELYQEVSQKADIDHLTELYNHGYFKSLLEEEIKTAKLANQSLSIGLIDLDDFKKYNDQHGHLQGDKLLKHFGAELKKSASDAFTAARYGGEEFALLMPGKTELEAYQFINHFRKDINDQYFEGVEVLPHGCLSFSAGIIQYNQDMYDSSEVLEKADQAMYYAKTKGKNNVCIFDADNVPAKTFYNNKEMELLEQQLKIFLYKDVYTYKHSRRVYEYAIEFSNKLNLNNNDQKILVMGALIHDIGKLEIPRDVINKKGKLTKDEWEMVQKHVIWGREIVSTNRELADLLPLVELHHERYDGKGYPYGLSGQEIPRLVRMLTIIDSFDAMTTERPYQKTKSISEAIDELQKCAETQFDPELVHKFIEVIHSSPLHKHSIEQPNKISI